MFQPVNHDSRLPSYLQNSTKENIAFQLTLVAVFIGGMWVKDIYQEKKLRKQLDTETPSDK